MAPKLKVRPTRAQAEILQELQEWQGLALIWKKGSSAEWTGPAWPLVKKKLGSPKSSTVRKLVAEGWLAPLYEEDTPYWRITDEGIDALARYEAVEIDPSGDMTAYDVLRALDRKFKPPVWILADEILVKHIADRRIDALALELSFPHKTIALEIKVSRSDYFHELKDPTKRQAGQEYASQFYFVTPPGLISIEELPADDSGLIEIRDGSPYIRHEAGILIGSAPTWDLVAQITQKARRTK